MLFSWEGNQGLALCNDSLQAVYLGKRRSELACSPQD